MKLYDPGNSYKQKILILNRIKRLSKLGQKTNEDLGKNSFYCADNCAIKCSFQKFHKLRS